MPFPEYLGKEYDSCFEQMRYYDTRQSDLLKYVISTASLVIGALFALYKYFNFATNEEATEFKLDLVYWDLSAILAGVVFAGTLLLYISTVQNRVYYVRVARQVNSLREYFLSLKDNHPFESYNQLWTRNPELPMASRTSLHTYQLIVAAGVPSVFLGILVWCWTKARNEAASPETATWLAALACFVVLLLIALIYLRVRDKDVAESVALAQQQGPGAPGEEQVAASLADESIEV